MINYASQVWNGLTISPTYNWSATNGIGASGNLAAAGAGRVIALTPVPYGLAVGRSVYISGGTGTAEAAAITAISGVAGALAGTITVTTVNTHTGAWAVGSASMGIQEALIAVGVGGSVTMPSGTLNIKATITMLANQSLVGQGRFSTLLNRQFSGATNLIDANPAASNTLRLQHFCCLMDNAFTSTGYAINHDGGGSESLIEDIQILSFNSNGGGGIKVKDSARVVLNVITIGDVTSNGLYWENSGGSVCNMIQVSAFATATSVRWVSGYLNGNNWSLQGTGASSVGILIQPGAGVNASESTISDVTLDSFGLVGLYAINNVGGSLGGIVFSNFRVSVLGVSISMISVSETTFSNWLFGLRGSASANGAIQIAGGNNLKFLGCNLVDGGLTVSSGGIALGLSGSPTTDVIIADSVIGYTITGALSSNFGFGILLNGASDRISIVNNKLNGTVGAIRTSSWTGTVAVIANNEGLDNLTPAVASASSVALPFNPNFTVTGTTGVGTITGQWAGRRGTFVTTSGAVVFTAGASIGNSFTTTQNVPVFYWSDGTKFWMK